MNIIELKLKVYNLVGFDYNFYLCYFIKKNVGMSINRDQYKKFKDVNHLICRRKERAAGIERFGKFRKYKGSQSS